MSGTPSRPRVAGRRRHERREMGVGEVRDMDVVADGRAIGRRVVVAEQRQRRAALDREQRVRDEVRLGPMDLAQPLGRARDVEVAQDARSAARSLRRTSGGRPRTSASSRRTC